MCSSDSHRPTETSGAFEELLVEHSLDGTPEADRTDLLVHPDKF